MEFDPEAMVVIVAVVLVLDMRMPRGVTATCPLWLRATQPSVVVLCGVEEAEHAVAHESACRAREQWEEERNNDLHMPPLSSSFLKDMAAGVSGNKRTGGS